MLGMSSLTPSQKIRCVLVPMLLTSTITPAVYRALLEQTWARLIRTSLYRWSTFETIWTVLCYAVIEPAITMIFINHPEWRFVNKVNHPSTSVRYKPKGMRRPSRRVGEILVYVLPLLAMDLTMIKKFADVPLSDMLESGNYDRVAGIGESNDTMILRSLQKTFLVPTLHNFSWSSPLQVVRAVPLEPPSSRRLVTELVASFILYDTLFFFFHFSLHAIRPLRLWHAPHHSHDAQINPQVTNQLSVVERLGLVMLANFSLNAIGAHVLTRTLFIPLFVWLLVEIHSGMDLPWAYEKILPHGWGGGALKHMKHHNAGNGGWEPFFCWWDRLWESKVIGRLKRQWGS